MNNSYKRKSRKKEDFPLAIIGLGGNLGNPQGRLARALHTLSCKEEIWNLKVSRFFKSAAISPIPQAPFINACAAFRTSWHPFELLRQLQAIERDLGKRAKKKEAPRKIDLDILFFEDFQMKHPLLQIPHPRWAERAFVTRPLADLFDHPRIKKLNDLLSNQNCKVLEKEIGFNPR